MEGYAITAHLTPKVSLKCWSTFWTLNLSHKICILLSAKYAPNCISLVLSTSAARSFGAYANRTIAIAKVQNNLEFQKDTRRKMKYLAKIFGVYRNNSYLCSVKRLLLAIRVSFPRGSKTWSTLLHFKKSYSNEWLF